MLYKEIIALYIKVILIFKKGLFTPQSSNKKKKIGLFRQSCKFNLMDCANLWLTDGQQTLASSLQWAQLYWTYFHFVEI